MKTTTTKHEIIDALNLISGLENGTLPATAANRSGADLAVEMLESGGLDIARLFKDAAYKAEALKAGEAFAAEIGVDKRF